MAYVNVHTSRGLKEELAWAIDKRLWLITNTMLFKTVIKQYFMHCYVTLSNLFLINAYKDVYLLFTDKRLAVIRYFCVLMCYQ